MPAHQVKEITFEADRCISIKAMIQVDEWTWWGGSVRKQVYLESKTLPSENILPVYIAQQLEKI